MSQMTFQEKLAQRKLEKEGGFEPQIDTELIEEELNRVPDEGEGKETKEQSRLQLQSTKTDTDSPSDQPANDLKTNNNLQDGIADPHQGAENTPKSENEIHKKEDISGTENAPGKTGYMSFEDSNSEAESINYEFDDKPTSFSERLNKKKKQRKSGFTDSYFEELGIDLQNNSSDERHDTDSTFESENRVNHTFGSERKEEDDNGEEKTKLEKLVYFVRSPAGKLTFVGVGVLVITTYIVGFIARFFKGDISANPFKVYASAFRVPSFPKIFLILLLLSAVVSLFLFALQKKGEEGNKERNFSSGGELGTATLMTKREQNLLIERVKNFNDISSICYGKDIATNEFIGRKEPSNLNFNMAIFGSQGSSKSEGFARNNIEIQSRRGNSMIITDPKGELYLDTAKMLEQRGYTIKVWNLINFLSSDSCDLFKAVNKADIDQLITTIIANTEDDGANKGDRFFVEIERMALRAISLYVMDFDEVNDDDRTLGRVYELLVTKTPDELDELFTKNAPPSSEAAQSWHLFRANKQNQANALLGLGARLQDLQSKITKELVSQEGIDLELPGKEKCAYFIIRKAQNDSYKFLSSLMLTLLFNKLSSLAERKESKKLDVKVNFILDEFIHMGIIPNFKNILGTVRSYGMGIIMFFQNLPQMMDTFGENLSAEILGGCHTTLLLGCSDPETAKYFSDLSGMATIKTEQIRKSLNTIRMTNYTPDFQQSSSVTQANVLNPDEILNLNTEDGGRGYALLFINGSRGLKIKKSFAYRDNPVLQVDKRGALKQLDSEHMPDWVAKKLKETHWEREDISERGGIYKLFDSKLSDVPEGYDVKLDQWREEGLKEINNGKIDKDKIKATLYARNKINSLVDQVKMSQEEVVLDFLEELTAKGSVSADEYREILKKYQAKENNNKAVRSTPAQEAVGLNEVEEGTRLQDKKPIVNNEQVANEEQKTKQPEAEKIHNIQDSNSTNKTDKEKPKSSKQEPPAKQKINFNVTVSEKRSKGQRKAGNVESLSSIINKQEQNK